MKKNTFKVLFYIRGNRVNKDGNVAVMIRITVDGEMEQLNSKLVVNPEIWDAKTGRAIGWKNRGGVTPEAEGRLTTENFLILTPKVSWPTGSFLFQRITSWRP